MAQRGGWQAAPEGSWSSGLTEQLQARPTPPSPPFHPCLPLHLAAFAVHSPTTETPLPPLTTVPRGPGPCTSQLLPQSSSLRASDRGSHALENEQAGRVASEAAAIRWHGRTARPVHRW